MLVNKKGVAIAWGAILAILFITSFVVMSMVGKGAYSQTLIVKSGAIISFVNNAEAIMRTYNVSIIPISQRAAYDLGKIGGYNKEFWTTSPNLEELKSSLRLKILENLPSGEYSNGRTLNWLENNLTIIPCEPLDSSKCFTIKGWQMFSYSDTVYSTSLIINNSFDQKVPSSYFKLLNIARKIVDNHEYIRTSSQLTADYHLTISNSLSGGVYTITITDNRCSPEFYCLAPLKADENKQDINGDIIPFDYLSLTFKVKP